MAGISSAHSAARTHKYSLLVGDILRHIVRQVVAPCRTKNLKQCTLCYAASEVPLPLHITATFHGDKELSEHMSVESIIRARSASLQRLACQSLNLSGCSSQQLHAKYRY